jgi:hypothetical protein
MLITMLSSEVVPYSLEVVVFSFNSFSMSNPVQTGLRAADPDQSEVTHSEHQPICSKILRSCTQAYTPMPSGR